MRHKSLPLEQLASWAKLNGTSLSEVAVVADIPGKGGGLVSLQPHTAGDVLLSVPSDILLSTEQIQQCKKLDSHLMQVLDAAASFTKSTRLVYMVFLLVQLTHNSPDAPPAKISVQGAFADYVQFLPKVIPLPTFYNAAERETLIGTSLFQALEQKLDSLEHEFEQFKDSTEQVEWCRELWWDEEDGILTLDDWKLVDALYRSRALEAPGGRGEIMCPILDMVNHEYDYNARFDMDEDGSMLLLVREGKSIADGEEISIMYGAGGACEMLFSYGFIDPAATSAREMFLGLSMPSDDPLRRAKLEYAQEAPGVRVYVDQAGIMRWESPFIWWACVNEEDGLDFEVLQTTDGQRQLQAAFKGEPFQASVLKDRLVADERGDIFHLRTVVMIQQKVEDQGMLLANNEEPVEHPQIRESVKASISKLRDLEMALLATAFESLESEKTRLLQSPQVQNYLSHSEENRHPSDEVEDFS